MFNAFFDAFKNLLVCIQVWGSSQVPTGQRVADTFVAVRAVAITAGTPVSIWTPPVGKKFRLLGYDLASNVAAKVLLEDGTGNEFIRIVCGASTAYKSTSPPMGNGYLSTTANNALFVDANVSITLDGYVFGVTE
jgi:hypothetical protein